MTDIEKNVKLIMKIWYKFVQEHGGKNNINGKILKSWPDFLKESLIKKED